MNKEKIATLLGQGLSPSVVASVVGCTPAYISQLASDEQFKALVASKRVEQADAPEEEIISTKYLGMEHKLLAAMEQALPNAELPAITAALRVVAERQEKAKSRLLAPALQANQNVTVVQISMPQQAMPRILLNEQREVIAIDNKPMAPLASSAVQQMFQKKREERELALQEQLKQATAVPTEGRRDASQVPVQQLQQPADF